MGIAIILWIIGVILLILVGFYFIVKKLNKSNSIDYKYKIDFNKVGFENTDYPLIKLKIRGKYKHFLLDSGANINAISFKAMKSLVKEDELLEIVGNNKISGIEGESQESYQVIRETISINKDKFTEPFSLMTSWESLRSQISKAAKVDVIGLLGSEFFSKAKWVLDFDKLVVWVKK
jgi:hypothetical protein